GRREDREWKGCGWLAERVQKQQPCAIGETQVEHRGIVGDQRQRLARVIAGSHSVYSELSALQGDVEDLRHARLIFDNQQTHRLALDPNCLIPAYEVYDSFKAPCQSELLFF